MWSFRRWERTRAEYDSTPEVTFTDVLDILDGGTSLHLNKLFLVILHLKLLLVNNLSDGSLLDLLLGSQLILGQNI